MPLDKPVPWPHNRNTVERTWADEVEDQRRERMRDSAQGNRPLHEVSVARYLKVHAQQVAKGFQEYGKPLAPFNGRDAAGDCRAELVDALDYLTQLEMERDEIQRQRDEWQRRAIALGWTEEGAIQ